MSPQELQVLRAADPPREKRVDARNVIVDTDAPVAARVQRYLEQIKNPYAFMCGDIAVNIEFSPAGKTLREAMVSCFNAIKN